MWYSRTRNGLQAWTFDVGPTPPPPRESRPRPVGLCPAARRVRVLGFVCFHVFGSILNECNE